jgi:alanine racemase
VRWAWVEVDHEAIAHNVRALRDLVEPAELWAVVKADGYGHGAVEVARTARAAGAGGLGVALVQEGVELREAGDAGPVIVLSEQPAEELGALVRHGLTATVYSERGVDDLCAAAAREGMDVAVHLKVDTGMHRVGAAPDRVAVLAERILASPRLVLDGVFTHFAQADEPGAASIELQAARFAATLAELDARGRRPPRIHAVNSAGGLTLEGLRHSLVRAGIAVYGIEPGPAVGALTAWLRPALSLHARVTHVQRVAAGEGVSYGWRHVLDRPATVATLPLGYADGVPRRLFATGGEVLLRGRRRRIVGVVTMDQLMVDCGDDDVAVGDEAVLIGAQLDPSTGEVARVRAEEWAERLGTIGYEIVCGISARVPRVHVGRQAVPIDPS